MVLWEAGRRWDAVRTTATVARWAFEMLDVSESCAAIIDPYAATTYWLLPAGQAAESPHWDRLGRHVAVLGPGPGTHYVGIPSPHRRSGPGVHWRLPVGWSGRYLAQPYYLGAVLASAVRFAHGPQALTPACPVCADEPPRTTPLPPHGEPGICRAEAGLGSEHPGRSYRSCLRRAAE
ncbi:hypothetical protein [Streptomyces sp. NPDC057702]|uniref:hypothetical protein n=1 Tax=unclassified Streptomyces TaxID=2593676 RepID=UPI0036C9CCF5